MPPARIALVSSPRSGNTWLRRLLTETFDLAEIAVYHPYSLLSYEVPERAIIQIHWRRDDDAARILLDELGCKVVTIVRHPLDVLVSIVRFAGYEPRTALWLLGKDGNEESIAGRDPNDRVVVAYAKARRFRRLLDVSAEWWDEGLGVVYEQATADPSPVVDRIAGLLDLEPARPVDETIEATAFARLHAIDPTHHPVGQQGGWRSFLTAATVEAILPKVAWHLGRFGYDAGTDDLPDASTAIANWEASLPGARSPVVDATKRVDRLVGYVREELHRTKLEE